MPVEECQRCGEQLISASVAKVSNCASHRLEPEPLQKGAGSEAVDGDLVFVPSKGRDMPLLQISDIPVPPICLNQEQILDTSRNFWVTKD